jgi:UDP-4-amino-4,6-dideoxy-N-acetyl-beta-L-altrosamine N-acetyltransferase
MISYEGKITRLRPLQKTDIEKSLKWRNDPVIRENLIGIRFPVTRELETAWYESALEDRSNKRVIFGIETKEENSLLGFVYLINIDWISRHTNFGILIGEKEYHGKGIGQEAMTILFRYAFDALNLRKICLEVASFNQPAIRLYQKIGFKEEGKLKQHVYLEGEYHDLIIMSIFNKDFVL